MIKPSRSNAPLALSVVSVTTPGNVRATIDAIMEFDEVTITFTHARTWAALPVALRGVISSTSSTLAFPGTHPRVENCIRALCVLGESKPAETHRFSDHPDSGLKSTSVIDWSPTVKVKVKGVCWYIRNGVPMIPLLQPRKTALSDERLSCYITLGRQAFCQGDWYNAQTEVIDLSGDEKVVTATVISEKDLPALSDQQIERFMTTYLDAKAQVDTIRASRPKKPPKPSGPDLFDPR